MTFNHLTTNVLIFIHVVIFFTCSEVIQDNNYKFSDSGMYYSPKHGSYDSYLDYFRSLPLTPHPEVITFCVTGGKNVGLILIKNY